MKNIVLDTNTSPMMQQYLSLKSEYKNYLLFFRMGDFYELFFDDAKIAAKILDIALTKRGKDKNIDIPMCGVPFHSYEPYLEKLIKNNYKVAICEQLESPIEAKKRGYKAIVKRGVVRVVTAATVTEENLLNPKKANFLLAITIDRKNSSNLAISWSDITVGEIFTQNINSDQLNTYLSLIDAKEILINENLLNYSTIKTNLQNYNNLLVNFVPSYFDINKNINILKDFYKINFTEAFGNLSNLELSVAGAIISYIQITQKNQIPKLSFPKSNNSQEFLQIDHTSLKSLEIFTSTQKNNSLYSFLDQTKTASGARQLYQYLSKPLLDSKKIEQRLNQVEFLSNNWQINHEIRELLKFFPDLERAAHKLLLNRGGPRDVLIIVNSLITIEGLYQFYQKNQNNLSDEINKLLENLAPLTNLSQKYNIILPHAPLLAREGNFIISKINKQLDYYQNLQSNAEIKFKELEEKYQKLIQSNKLKIKKTNILGYYIEISKNSNLNVDDSIFIHRQTLSNSIRYVTTEIIALQNDLNQAKQKALEIELSIFSDLITKLEEDLPLIKPAISTISILDIYSNFAFIAKNHNFIKPEINHEKSLNIEEGFHPIVQNNLPANITEFTTNNCNLSSKQNFWLITGPNMAGKSTFLRQNALIIIMAQIGCFVPAKKAQIGIVDKIFSRVGASDDLSKGRSTFMLEMLETATIINNASENSFLILDEIGRGTATFDGMSLAWAISEYIHNKITARTLFATHYHELAILEKKLVNFKCYYSKVSKNNDQIIFQRKIIPGTANKSYGIDVAALAGLPSEITKRATTIMQQLEDNKPHNFVQQLSLFSTTKPQNNNNHQDPQQNIKNKLFKNIKNLDIDQINPKQALDLLYEYHKELK